MIYNANKSLMLENARVPEDQVIAEEFYLSATKDRDPVMEDAYLFLYESDHNFNTIVNEINLQESKAADMNSVLVLEAVDIKKIFHDIKEAIKAAWRRFVQFITNIKNRIVEFFNRNKKTTANVSDADMEEKFEEWVAEEEDIEIIDVDESMISEVENNIKTGMVQIFDKIDKIETMEQIEEVKSEVVSTLVGGTASASSDSLPTVIEDKLGLNKKISAKKKYKSYKDIKAVEGPKAGQNVDQIARTANEAIKKADSQIDKYAASLNKDLEDYKVEVAKANLYRTAANAALTGATAVSKALFTDAKQKAAMTSKIAGSIENIASADKLLEKKLDVWESTKGDTPKNIWEPYIDKAKEVINTRNEEGEDLEGFIYRKIERNASVISNKLYASSDPYKLKKDISLAKTLIREYINLAKENNIQTKSISVTEFELKDHSKWDQDYCNLVFDLVVDDETIKDNPEVYYHYIAVDIWDRSGHGHKGRPAQTSDNPKGAKVFR